jgi:hypothetical protein
MFRLRVHKEGELRSDTRGAVLVLGIALGALLVAALWQLCGVAEAMIWRETAQDAADAVAFEHAVWSARGMNVIVMVNIVMSLVMFVMVVWRTALIALGIAMVLTLPGGLVLLPVVEQLLMLDYRVIAPTVIRIVSAMNAVEMGIATAAPVIAVVESTRNTSNAFGGDSAAYSASLLPNDNTDGISTAIDCLSAGRRGRGAGAGAGSQPALPPGTSQPALPPGSSRPAGSTPGTNPSRRDPTSPADLVPTPGDIVYGRMGTPVSLPVADDAFSLLCNKGGSFAWNNASGLMEQALGSVISESLGAHALANALVLPLDLTRNAIGFVTGLLPGVFCAPLGDAPISLSGVMSGLPVGAGQMDSFCEGQLSGRPRRFRNGQQSGTEEVFEDPYGPDLLTRTEWLDRCRQRGRYAASSTARGRLKGALNGIAAVMPETECGKPAKVWEYAGNGNIFMRSFGTSRLPGSSLTNDRSLEVGDGDATGNVIAAAPGEVRAQAEMFFDCEGTWGLTLPPMPEQGWNMQYAEELFRKAVPGEACGPNAMWIMRWQARLRRVHALDTLVGADLNSLIYGFMRQGPGNLGDIPLFDWASQVLNGYLSSGLDGDWRDGFSSVVSATYEEVFGADVSVGDVTDRFRTQVYGREPDDLRQFLDQHRDRSATIH